MKFSIIVPIYNVDKYLSECISSILNQTFSDFELILVNDGSTDESLSICNYYAAIDSRIVVIDQENKWLSAARNAGIKIANGDFYIFVDGDDALRKDALQKINEKIDDETIVCYSYCNIINDNIIKDNYIYGDITNFYELKKDFLMSDRFGSACMKCVGKNYFNGKISSILFNENTRFAEDQIYTCDLLNFAKKIEFINEPLYVYRIRQGSIMTKYNIARIQHIEYYLDYIKNNFLIDGINEKEKKKLFNKRIIDSCVAEIHSICEMQLNKKDKLLMLNEISNYKYFKNGHFDVKKFLKSMVYIIAKYKIFRIILFANKWSKF